MKVILTGATGMVGEGVLLECLDHPEVERVLSVSRRSCGRSHPKRKGRAENAVMRLPFKGVYNFRPALMKPTPGQKYVKGGYYLIKLLYPLFSLIFPGMSLRDAARAMINAALVGAPKQVLEVADMRQLAAR